MSDIVSMTKVTQDNLPPPGARFYQTKEEQTKAPISRLAEHIREAWRVNSDHKKQSGIEQKMMQCTRQRNGEYDPEDKAKITADTCVFINITGLKCRAAESWIKDVLVNTADQPWTICPTPIPELSSDLKEQVVQMVMREVMARGYFDETIVRQHIAELKATGMREMQRLAAEASDKMTNKISDQLTEGNWREVFEQWQSDIITYPGGVLKGPVIRNRKSLKWNGQTLEAVVESVLVCERVSPLDLYPSPEATTPQNANSLIEKMRMIKSDLYTCIGLPNFKEDAIRLVIAEYETGYRDWLANDGTRAHDEKKSGTLWGTNETIDVLEYWGRVQGSVLMEWGIAVDDPEAQYECNAWLIGHYVIRALLSPDPLGRRPYHVSSFNKLPGQFWGEGIPQLLRDIQRSANSAARDLIRNMAFASGPIIEADESRLSEEEDKPEQLTPWRVIYVKPAMTTGDHPAIRYVLAPSVANELMGIFNQFMKMADDFSGVPAYSYGNTSVSGAGKTMGGLSLLYGNALKGIKNVIMNMDRDGIEPMITQYFTYNMLYDEDDSIKADAKVVAKGSEGILQKEQAQARSIETLQVVMPMIQSGLIPPQGAQFLAKQWLKENGYDLSAFFPDTEVDQEIAGVFSQQATTNPGTPPPGLDGRQAAAVQALQSQ